MNAITSSTSRAQAPGALVAFFVLACAISWADWFAVIGSARGWVPFHVGPNPWGSFGPALAAVILAWFDGRSDGVRALFAPLRRWRVGATTWLLALLGPWLIVGAAVGIAVAMGEPLGAIAAVDPLEAILLSVAILIVGGPLGEEVGWRGHALPALLRTHSPIVASLLVAAMWAAWHVPLFWMPGAEQEGTSLWGFVLLLAAFSVMTTWLWLRSGRSLLIAIAFHWAINVSTYLMPGWLPALADSKSFSRALLGVGLLGGIAALGSLWRRDAVAVAP
ncbi:MAG: lysostaphin resistance A-like protein [Arenimonas sp.]